MLILQGDIKDIFEYVEPDDRNLCTYGFRIHQLLTRVCIEIESNLKSILKENEFAFPAKPTMRDYSLVEKSHFLSAYSVRLPYWNGTRDRIEPFAEWRAGERLAWFHAYNLAKHDRHIQFTQANFSNLLNAFGGLVALITAQFGFHDFSGVTKWGSEANSDGYKNATGNLFQVKVPDFPERDQYCFTSEEWDARVKVQDKPFEIFKYRSKNERQRKK